MFKGLEFRESKYPVVKISFWLIIIFSLISILLVFKSYPLNFSVKGFASPLETVKVTVELDKKIDANSMVFCFNDYCAAPETNDFYNYYYSEFSPLQDGFFASPLKSIYFAYEAQRKNFENEIKSIDVNIGNKNYYYTKEDIKKFERKKCSIRLSDDKIQSYNALIFPEAGNYKGIFSHIAILFLSLFYNWQTFIIPCFWLFCAYLIYVFNKDKFNFKSSDKTVFWLFLAIVLLGIFLRWTGIDYYPLWMDEIYTKTVTAKSFIACFQDAGNPPLFFILEYFFAKISPVSDASLRFLPFVFGVLSVPAVFVLFKNTDKKLALFAAFFTAVNTMNIYHSQEARGYSLSMLLSVILIYFLFNFLKNPQKKNLICYSIFAILALNTNYYLLLLVFTNFIWGVVDLFENQNKKQIKSFVFIHLIAALTFIPYLIISSKAALSASFNSWIPKLGSDVFLYIINEYFINKYVFLFLCIVLLINLILCFVKSEKLAEFNLKINTDKENLLIYLIYTFALILILASLISIFIKPIVHKRVLISLYGLLMVLEVVCISSVLEFIKFNKIQTALKALYSFILVLVCFSITKPMPLRELLNLHGFMNFVKNDAKQYEKAYEIHVVTSGTKEYSDAYGEIAAMDNIHWHYLDTTTNSVLKSIKKSNYTKSEKAVIYFNSIGVDTASVSFFNPRIYIHKSNLTTSAKIVYD